MKSHAWQFDHHGEPREVLHWREQELAQPGPGEVLVKIRAVGLNHADLAYVRGQYFPPESFPTCVGEEAVGEIIAVGDSQDGLQSDYQIGSRVALSPLMIHKESMGVFRDIGLYDQGMLLPVPDDYSDEEVAALWLGVITMAGALEMAGIKPGTANGKRILVTAGASGMGIIALKLANAWGAKTIATTRNHRKSEILEKFTDHMVVCDNSETLAEGVKQATDNQGADVILDPVGAAFYPGLIEAAASGGHIVSYESMSGDNPKLSIMDMMMKDLSIHGYTVFRPLQNPKLLKWLVNIGLEYADLIRPEIAAVYDMSDAVAALETLGQSEHIGKLILTA